MRAVRFAGEQILVTPLADRRAVGGEEPEIRRDPDHHQDRSLAVCSDPGGRASPLLWLLHAEVALQRVLAEQAGKRGGGWGEWRGWRAGRRLSEQRRHGRDEADGYGNSTNHDAS